MDTVAGIEQAQHLPRRAHDCRPRVAVVGEERTIVTDDFKLPAELAVPRVVADGADHGADRGNGSMRQSRRAADLEHLVSDQGRSKTVGGWLPSGGQVALGEGHALLNHDGDHAVAAKALSRLGYGRGKKSIRQHHDPFERYAGYVSRRKWM